MAMHAIKGDDKIFLQGLEGVGMNQELGLHRAAGVPCTAKPSLRDQRIAQTGRHIGRPAGRAGGGHG
jgi:hypothetical protein